MKGCLECGNGIAVTIGGEMVLVPDTDRLCPVGQELWRSVRAARVAAGPDASDDALDFHLDAHAAFFSHFVGAA